MNEYWARELLKKNDLDYNKFYKKHLETFLDISRKDNKELQQKINKAIEYIKSNDFFYDASNLKKEKLTEILVKK